MNNASTKEQIAFINTSFEAALAEAGNKGWTWSRPAQTVLYQDSKNSDVSSLNASFTLNDAVHSSGLNISTEIKVRTYIHGEEKLYKIKHWSVFDALSPAFSFGNFRALVQYISKELFDENEPCDTILDRIAIHTASYHEAVAQALDGKERSQTEVKKGYYEGCKPTDTESSLNINVRLPADKEKTPMTSKEIFEDRYGKIPEYCGAALRAWVRDGYTVVDVSLMEGNFTFQPLSPESGLSHMKVSISFYTNEVSIFENKSYSLIGGVVIAPSLEGTAVNISVLSALKPDLDWSWLKHY